MFYAVHLFKYFLMNNIHILILPSWYPSINKPLNGIFFAEQAKALLDSGLRVGVVAPIQRGIRQLRGGNLGRHRFVVDFAMEAGIPTFRSLGWAIPKSWYLNRMLYLAQTKRLIREYIKCFGKPDLIHAHSCIFGGIAASRAADELAVPYIITEHSTLFARGLIPKWQKPEIAQALMGASACIAVSGSLRGKLLEYSAHCQIDVVPNVIDTEFFCRPGAPRTFKPFVFLTVAVLHSKKGIQLLLQAFAAKFKGVDGVEVWIGGDGPERRNLERLATSLDIASQVRFLGMLSREKVRENMWQASAFVLPSYYETFGVVFVEAMSTGLPAIGTRCGGPEEIITPQVGRLVASGDVVGLGNAMQALRDEYFRYDAEEISQAMAALYSTTSVCGKLKEIYARVLKISDASIHG
jgi:glycosyltransferase involved in cell wall biosynthesis